MTFDAPFGWTHQLGWRTRRRSGGRRVAVAAARALFFATEAGAAEALVRGPKGEPSGLTGCARLRRPGGQEVVRHLAVHAVVPHDEEGGVAPAGVGQQP